MPRAAKKKKSRAGDYIAWSIAVIIVAGVVIAYGINPTLDFRQKTDEVSSGAAPEPLVPLSQIISGGPPKDGIPAIDNPKFVSADEARSFVTDDTLGILARVGDDARFYPYNIMLWHEIVNDEVGGKPLAVTFCPLCATGIVFEREIGGEVYDFGTSGKLYQSNLVMYDRQTDSYWSQALGKAIVGRLTGTELVVYPSAILEFGTAAENNPEMKVLSTNTGHVRDYTFNPYSSYENSDDVGFGATFGDDRLSPKTLTYGIHVEGEPKAYDYLKLIELGGLDDEFAGHKLKIAVDENKEIIVFDETDGKRIIGIVSFWFSWAAHNANSDLWAG